MKAVRLSFFQMAVMLRRDMMLSAACFAPVVAGFFFRFAVTFFESVLTDRFQVPAIFSPCYKLFDILFAMLPSVMFCFVSAMVCLEEADEKTAAYLFITPLGKTGYVSARFGVPAVLSFFAAVILLPVFKLTALAPAAVLLFAAGGTLQGIIVSLLVVTFSSNKLEGMAVAKLSALSVFGAVIPFFIKDSFQYVLFLMPSFWMGKAACDNTLLYMLPAFVLSVLWILYLVKRYLDKIR